jgi:hypothetical protein
VAGDELAFRPPLSPQSSELCETFDLTDRRPKVQSAPNVCLAWNHTGSARPRTGFIIVDRDSACSARRQAAAALVDHQGKRCSKVIHDLPVSDFHVHCARIEELTDDAIRRIVKKTAARQEIARFLRKRNRRQ